MTIIYWYPFLLGTICSLLIMIGVMRNNKNLVIIFSLLPAFFASPFLTFTRGAAGAITASDITGLTLLLALFFLPRAWKSPYRILPVKLLISFFVIVAISIWTMGLFYNLQGVEHTQNLRTENSSLLPFLIAGFRSIKLFTLFSYLVFYYLAFLDEKNIKCLINTIIIGSIVLAVAQIITRLGIFDLALAYGDTHGVYVGPRILGLTKASVGRLLFVGIVLSLVYMLKGKKLVYLISLPILASGLVLSGSRGGVVATIISLFFISILGRGRGFLIGTFGFLIVILSAVYTLDYSPMMKERLLGTFDSSTIETASTRTVVWDQALTNILQEPLVGVLGVGAFNFSYAGMPVNFEHAHNDFLTVLIELGVIGEIMFIALMISFLVYLYKSIKIGKTEERWRSVCIFSLFLGLLLASLFESTFYPSISTIPMLRIIFAILLVILLSGYKMKNFTYQRKKSFLKNKVASSSIAAQEKT